jgi:transposase
MIVEHIERLYRDEALSYRDLCAREGVSYASFMRWRSRTRAGEQPLSRPGPRKVGELDLDALREQVRVMQHGNRRTAGTGDLYRNHGDAISRRDLNRLVQEERERKKKERDRIVNRVSWKVPRLMWAMDDTEYQPDRRYPKAYLHAVQDLGSRYKFDPIVGVSLARGEEVAAHLARLFDEHGPPLFLKRDNGGNLNHHLVEALLCEQLVIPLNSPCQYPQYNGGIERAQGEIKSRLRAHEDQPSSFLAIQAELDLQAINHKPRPSLGNRTPCEVFTVGRDLARTYTRRKRKEIYDWIKEKTLALIETERYDDQTAWRIAVEKWLLEHRFISVSQKG